MDTSVAAQSVCDLIDRNAEAHPRAFAAILDGHGVTHGQLADLTFLAAQYLQTHRVGAGDRVAIFLPTASVDYLALSLGAMRLGAIAVCVNARFKTRELNHAIENSSCKVLFFASQLADVVAGSIAQERTTILEIDAIRQNWIDGDIGAARRKIAGTRIGPAAAARIIYTSGTTSMPKACLHTHSALLHQGAAVAERLELNSDDRFWTPLPLFHTGGWTPFLACQSVGASLHHVGFFDAAKSLRQIIEERCTVLFPSFETIWMQVLTHPDFRADDFASARLVLNVGVPERLALMQALLPHVAQISNTGSTEVGGFVCIGEASDPLNSRCRTAGRLLSGMEGMIVHPETGRQVADGVLGELVVRGPSCLREYYGDPAATLQAVDADGWFHTGDLLIRNAQGEFLFVSRIKDMLKVGGENVAAAEIEGHLLTHPKVHIVAVVAASDQFYGEVPAAFIELLPGSRVSEEEIIEFCRGEIATFKVPKYVRFVDEWPMSGTKIRKIELRERIEAELSRNSQQRAAT